MRSNASATTKVALKVAVVAVVQLAVVGVAVAPRLSARMTGEEYRLRVAPVDPIDPFRGAYVALDYPDIRDDAGDDPGDLGPLYVALVPDGDVWVARSYSRERPADGPYLACDDRDWGTQCGIESFFLPQDEAAAMEEDVAGGAMVAVVKVDDRGNAALVRVERA
jgi:uncharacterized membrane-anchored protein